MFRTEHEFSLPKGYIDEEGNLHKEGVMRLATAADEILPLRDPRVQGNPAYLTVILLSRVITKLGSISDVNPRMIEEVFASDLAYLQDFYTEINGNGVAHLKVECPKCQHKFEIESKLGE
jgi:hypothetical protein